MASNGGVDDVDFVALDLAGFAFGLFTAQPEKMRVSSRMRLGVISHKLWPSMIHDEITWFCFHFVMIHALKTMK